MIERVCAERTRPLCETGKIHFSLTFQVYPLPPPVPNKNRVSKGYYRDLAKLLRAMSRANRAEIVSSRRGGNSAPETSQPLIPRNHLQDSLVSFPCFQPRRNVHAPTTPNWVRPVAGLLYGVSKYFFTSRNPPGIYTEKSPSSHPLAPARSPPPVVATFIPTLLRDKGYACLYLKAADRMKCTMELSPHVAFREVKDVFRGLAVLPRRVSRPRKRTQRQKCLPDMQQHLYSRIG